VIVFDGAFGHLSKTGSSAFLEIVVEHLAPEGIFCGSESLGREGTDHLQFFDTLEDLRHVLASHFPHVRLKTQSYPILKGVRTEGYWRCSRSEVAINALDWT
jgi:hypothetical protein